MAQFWENDQQVTPQTKAPPKPVISLPDPGEDQSRANDNIRTGLAIGADARAGESAQRDTLKLAQDLRKEFAQLPQVREYQTVIRQFATALDTKATPQGDQALITAYAKMLDPGSVVREQEFNTVAQGDSMVGQLIAKIQKEGGFDGSGMLRPQIREQLRLEMLNLTKNYNEAYNQARQDFGARASEAGFEPEQVIGTHYGRPYFDRIQSAFAPKEQGQNGAPVLQVATGKTFSTDLDFANAKALNDLWAQGGSIEEMNNLSQRLTGSPLSPEANAYLQANNANRQAPAVSPAASGQRDAEGEWLRETGAGVASGLVRGFTGNMAEELVNFIDPATAAKLEAAANYGQEQAPIASFIGEAGGAFVSPLTRIGGSNIVRGATYGGIYGAGEGDPNAGLAERVPGALMGATLGGVAGKGGDLLGDWFGQWAAKRGQQASAPMTEGGQVIAAADRLNTQFGTKIAPTPADVGGATTRRVTGAMAQFPLAAGSIVRSAEKVTDEAQLARDAIASLAGTPGTRDAAGEAALTGANKYIQTSRTKVNSLYTKARKLGGDQPVDLANARQVLDDQIAELSQTPGGAEGLAQLKSLRAELDQPYPVEGVKRMRTTLRDKFVSDGLRASDLERRVGMVIDAADDDIVQSLQSAGKQDAASAYRAAADAHKERVGVIDNILAPIIGKNGEKSVEDVMKALDTATRTKGSRLGAFLKALPTEDAATVRGTLIQQLGKASKGAQNAEGSAFSLNDFLTHWNDMSDTAKSQLFGGELRSALEDLAKVAEGTKQAQRFANFSNTGGTVGILATGANGAGFFAAPITSTVALASQFGAGKLLASPSFARWLAKMPSGNPALVSKHVQGLSKVAGADSVIAADALGLQRQLTAAFSAGPQRLAAEPQDQGGQLASETTRTEGAGQ